MKKLIFTAASAALAFGVTIALVPSSSLAQGQGGNGPNGPPGTQFFEEDPSGVFRGGGRFPDEVFSYAEHSTAGQASCNGGTIDEMEVFFTTRDDGLAWVHFCGELDSFGGAGDYSLGARINDNSDCFTVRSDTFPDVGSDNQASDALVCYQWICKVDNDGELWVEHDVEVICDDSGSGEVQWNDRTLHVRYQAQANQANNNGNNNPN